MHYLIFSTQQPSGTGIRIPVFKGEVGRFREVKLLLQGCSAWGRAMVMRKSEGADPCRWEEQNKAPGVFRESVTSAS